MTEIQPQPPPEPSWIDRVLETPFTFVVALLNIGIFALVETHGRTTDTANLVHFGASERSHIWAGEYWRFVSPVFLHIGVLHVVWNTLFGFGLCRLVEKNLGPFRFILCYLLTGIGASATSVLCHDKVAAGASGALFGMIGIDLILGYRRLGSLASFFSDPQVKRVLLSIVIWTVLGFTVANWDNFAHLGGLAFGVMLGYVFVIARRISQTRFRAANAIVGVLLGATVGAASHHWPRQKASWPGYQAFNAAVTALKNDQAREGLRRLDEAERLGFREKELYYDRGLAKADLGDARGASEDFRKALELAPAKWERRAWIEKWLKDHPDP